MASRPKASVLSQSVSHPSPNIIIIVLHQERGTTMALRLCSLAVMFIVELGVL